MQVVEASPASKSEVDISSLLAAALAQVEQKPNNLIGRPVGLVIRPIFNTSVARVASCHGMLRAMREPDPSYRIVRYR